MHLSWRTCAGARWCAFDTVVLPDANASGILLVWSDALEPIVYLAPGGIAKNLKWARQFRPIAERRDLFVTWATIPEQHQNGVRNYLLERLRPVHCDRPTADAPVAVNLPWEHLGEAAPVVKEGGPP